MYLDDLKDAVLATIKTEAGKLIDFHKQKRLSKFNSSKHTSIMAELKKLLTRISLIERRGFEIYEGFADGKICKESYLADKAQNNSELTEAKARIEKLEQQLATLTTSRKSESIINEPILQRLLNSTELTDEAVSLVEKITVFDGDRIEIQFGFGDTNI